MMVDQYAQNEQNMNAVERVLVYVDLPPEGLPPTRPDPPPSWPEKGGVKFNDVELAYREGLPLVLKGVSFNVKPTEKVRFIVHTVVAHVDWTFEQIGIVGRTGAGAITL